jgi:hypothetical protein
MDRLHTQHHRLYLPLGTPDNATRLLGDDGRVRALVLALCGPADWAALVPLWRGVQADLKWPEPAIVVNGRGAFELWFSLVEPLPQDEAARMLAQLQHRYLGGVRADRMHAWPGADAAGELPACPPFAAGPERWAAFVTPDLPAVFGDDPVLDFEPGADAQAELLARLRPVSAAELRHGLAALGEAGQPAVATHGAAALPTPKPLTPPLISSVTAAIGPYNDPSAFLTAVMNDTTVALALRIEAAKGLLQTPGRAG